MKLLAALLIGVGAHMALASPVMAEPCTGVYNQGSCRPAPWNGQQMDTWNIPGTYGGCTETNYLRGHWRSHIRPVITVQTV